MAVLPNLLLLTTYWIIVAALPHIGGAPEGRIIGGHEAMPYSYPYMVSLQTRFLWARVHFCGGSLLNNYWVLTAGHCIKESWLIRWLPMDVVAGAHDVNNFGPRAQIATVDRRIPHPLYKGGIGAHDIALLKTKLPFIFTSEIQPLNLPQANFKLSNEQHLSLTGWGVLRTTLFFPDLPSRLQEVTVTFVPYNDCYEAIEKIKDDNEDNPLDADSNICTGPLTGGIAACSGDSGGPLVHYTRTESNETNLNQSDSDIKDDSDDGIITYKSFRQTNKSEDIPVVIGVVSWGVSPCGEKGAPTVYTKVTPHIDFINQHIET